MGAIYNIYFKCETLWLKPSYCTKQQSIYPSLWQLSPRLQRTRPRSTGVPSGAWRVLLSLQGERLSRSWPHSPEHCLRFLRSVAQGLLAPFAALHLGPLPFSFPWSLRPGDFPFSFGKLQIINILGLEGNSERALSSVPFANEDTGAQSSEGTWRLHLGNLWWS